jgi:hypothetical protein
MVSQGRADATLYLSRALAIGERRASMRRCNRRTLAGDAMARRGWSFSTTCRLATRRRKLITFVEGGGGCSSPSASASAHRAKRAAGRDRQVSIARAARRACPAWTAATPCSSRSAPRAA